FLSFLSPKNIVIPVCNELLNLEPQTSCGAKRVQIYCCFLDAQQYSSNLITFQDFIQNTQITSQIHHNLEASQSNLTFNRLK
ncbi:hypothetical protein, partial [Salegentibacter sp. BLCTC]|uniref:hypothetical protein n=1 Tax=Salegentibacter sp. BLCTC TaxID=2697368 RepID=UPI001D100A48